MVGTLDETADGISGTFTHQINQTEKEQSISLFQIVLKIYALFCNDVHI